VSVDGRHRTLPRLRDCHDTTFPRTQLAPIADVAVPTLPPLSTGLCQLSLRAMVPCFTNTFPAHHAESVVPCRAARPYWMPVPKRLARQTMLSLVRATDSRPDAGPRTSPPGEGIPGLLSTRGSSPPAGPPATGVTPDGHWEEPFTALQRHASADAAHREAE